VIQLISDLQEAGGLCLSPIVLHLWRNIVF